MNSQPADNVLRTGMSQQPRSHTHSPSPRVPQHHTAQSDTDYTHVSEMQASEEYEARHSSNSSIYSSNSLVNESSIPVDLNKKGVSG